MVKKKSYIYSHWKDCNHEKDKADSNMGESNYNTKKNRNA